MKKWIALGFAIIAAVLLLLLPNTPKTQYYHNQGKIFGTYYNINEAVWAEITADEVLELIDSCQGYIKAMNDLASILTDKKVETKPVKVIKTKDADEILNAFLKRQGW